MKTAMIEAQPKYRVIVDSPSVHGESQPMTLKSAIEVGYTAARQHPAAIAAGAKIVSCSAGSIFVVGVMRRSKTGVRWSLI